MIELPAFKVTQGQPATYSFTWTGQNLSTWTGVVTLKAVPQGDTLLTITPSSLTSGGVVTFSLTAAQASTLPALARIGYFVTAVFEVKLTPASGTGETFQGPVLVAGAV